MIPSFSHQWVKIPVSFKNNSAKPTFSSANCLVYSWCVGTFRALVKSQIARNIAEVLFSSRSSAKLTTIRIVAVTDNVQYMDGATRDTGLSPHIKCLAQTINLAAGLRVGRVSHQLGRMRREAALFSQLWLKCHSCAGQLLNNVSFFIWGTATGCCFLQLQLGESLIAKDSFLHMLWSLLATFISIMIENQKYFNWKQNVCTYQIIIKGHCCGHIFLRSFKLCDEYHVMVYYCDNINPMSF